MVLKQCSIKYSLLFYFTGFLGEADDGNVVLELPTTPDPLLCSCHVGMATVVLSRSQRAPTWQQQHCSSGEVAEVRP